MARAVPTGLAPGREEEARPEPSGRLLLRMPRALHAELTRSAERDGVSLNGFITSALAKTVGWNGDGVPAPDDEPRAARQARLVVVALFANVVVIGLVAITAIVLLLLAWSG